MAVNLEKLEAVILAVAGHDGVESLGLTKLYKLIYFADVARLRDAGKSISGSDYIKYEHGPVPSRGEKCVKRLRREDQLLAENRDYNGYRMLAISALANPKPGVLAEEELSVIDQVCLRFGHSTAAELSDVSHHEPAWIDARRLEKLSPELMLYGASEDPDGL